KLSAESIRYTARFVPHFEFYENGNVKLNVKIKDVKFHITNFNAQYKLTQNQGSLRVNVITKLACDSLSIQSARDTHIEALGTIIANQPWINDLVFVAEPQ